MQSNISVSEIISNLVIMEKNVEYIMRTRGNVGNVSFRYTFFSDKCASQGQELLNYIDYIGESLNRGDFSVYNDYLETIQMFNLYISQYS